MKRLLALVLFSSLMVSCGSSKVVRESRKEIKGYWSLEQITYSESGKFNVTIFNDTSAECMEGSSWRFIPNNNRGTYEIQNADCPTGVRNFIFDIQEVDANTGLYDFMLKPTDEKYKSSNNIGFRLRLAQMTTNSMQWEQTVSLEGKPFTIYMNFTKISD